MPLGKLLHFSIGFSLSAMFCIFELPFLGLATALVVSLLKDVVYDLWLEKGTFDWLDIVATVIGGTVPALAVSFKILLWG